MPLRIFMCNDRCSFTVQPCISIRVVEMPVRIDQMRDRVLAKAVGRFQDSPARCRDSSINENLAVHASQDGDIAPRALKYTNAATQPVDLDWRLGRLAADQVYNVSCLSVGLRGTQTASGGSKSGGDRATDAEATS